MPFDPSLSAPLPLPEPSYLTMLGKAVTFESNLIIADQLRRFASPAAQPGNASSSEKVSKLSPEASFTLSVTAGRTYLVELFAAVADPKRLTPHTRLEINVVGPQEAGNLPYIARLPLSGSLTRRRAAFRANETGSVTMTLRAVEPRSSTGNSKQPALTYEAATASDAGLLVGDLVVAGMNFGGRKLVYDGSVKATLERDAPKGTASRLDTVTNAGSSGSSKLVGSLSSLVMPWTDGNSTVRHEPYPCPLTSLRLVDGAIADQETAWTTQARGNGIDRAECRVRFKTPQEVRSIALDEDHTGPVAELNGVKERASPRFGVYVHDSATQRWRPVGVVVDNHQLIHIFPCPTEKIDEILYFWAGRTDSGKTDGLVRLAELEVHSAEDLLEILGNDVDSLLKDKPASGKK